MKIPDIDWGKVLGSKAFENVAAVGGSALLAHGQSKDQKAATEGANANTASSLMQRLLEAEQLNRANAAVGAANASPLGANTNFSARQAALAEILGSARNFSVTPGDPDVAAAMGTVQGGLRLPDGGLSKSVLAHYSPEATASAIAERARLVSNIDPTSGTPNLEAMGYDPSVASRFGTQMSDYAAGRGAETSALDDKRRAQIMAALDRDITGAAQPDAEKKDTPWWKKALKIAAIAAPIAAIPFTFGASAAISPAAMGAIGLGAGAARKLAETPSGAGPSPNRSNPYSGVRF